MTLSFEEAILGRRSVKKYDSSFVIPQEDIDKIIFLSMHSPSSFNIQHWRLVNVTDMMLRQQICDIAWKQSQIIEASHLFVLCADIMAFDKNPKDYWRDSDSSIQDIMVPMITKFYQNNPQLQREEALRSVGIFAQSFMLSVHALGYDSCPMIGFDANALADLIKLPDDHLIGMMVSVGKAQEPAKKRSGMIDLQSMVHVNSF